MFSFTDSDSFDSNLQKFLEYMKEEDPLHGEILSDLAATIPTSNDTTERSRSRGVFNAEVTNRLDEESTAEPSGVEG